jgi:ADP-ribosylglycohydrolase
VIGGCVGDIVGSVYEFSEDIKTTEFTLFTPECFYTDDTVLSIATSFAILHNLDYGKCYRVFGKKFPNCGYGSGFLKWIFDDSMGPYNSFGNGSAMRVSPVGFAFNTKEKVLEEAKKSAECTHSHPEGIAGAQATALAVFMARNHAPREEIRQVMSDMFGYDMSRTVDSIRPTYQFEVSCQKTVPEAIIAFLESETFEHAIRLAISLGGDCDTVACVTGGIAQAYYGGVPRWIAKEALSRLPKLFLKIIKEFRDTYHMKIVKELEG